MAKRHLTLKVFLIHRLVRDILREHSGFSGHHIYKVSLTNLIMSS